MTIVLLENENALKIFLKNDPPAGVLSYLALSEISPDMTESLRSKGYTALAPIVFDETRRDRLVTAYVDLIGEVNRRLNSRLWWAADLSSKNRFNNQLPILVQKFLSVIEAVKTAPDGILAVCPVPWQIRLSLRKFLLKSGIPHQEYFSPLRYRIELFNRSLKLSGAHIFHFLRTLARWAYSRSKLGHKLSKDLTAGHGYYVVKCFIYGHSFSRENGSYCDIFYNKLPDFLTSQGKKIVFFANVLGDFRVCVKKILTCPNAVIVPLEHFLSFKDIFIHYSHIAGFRPRLKNEILFEGHDVSDLLNAEIMSGAGKIQPYQYLHFAETQGLLKKIQAEAFLMTYENNPWEKMCILAVRDVSPQTRILAYQHTVNPQASVNMFHSQAEESFAPKPDRVLAIGEISKQIIERYSQSHRPVIEPACALQFEHLWKLTPYPRTRTNTILLGLEGIFDVYKMINYVLAQLQGSQKYKIIIRAHPVLPVKAMEHKLIYVLKDLSNVEVSQGFSLLKDIERSDMMIYWGSMAALEALWMGKPLVHFDMGTMFSYDPLFDAPYFKWVVSARTDLLGVIEKIYALADHEFFSERDKAKAYLKSYFAEVTPAKLAKFLP